MFLMAFLIIALGQVLFYPTSQAMVGKLASEDLRGRYMAVAGIAWSLQVMTAPLLGGYFS